MSTLPPPHPTYTPPQLARFFNHIRLPRSQSLRYSHPSLASAAEKLHFLTQLQRLTLAAVPLENLASHYTSQPEDGIGIGIDPDVLFERIVGDGSGRGGLCVENNTFFGTVLRSLGFEVYAAGARVCAGTAGGGAGAGAGEGSGKGKGKGKGHGKGEEVAVGYLGWSHMVLIVTIAAQRYMVDVGFGRNGPTLPLLLENNAQEDGIAPGARVRLVRDSLPQSLHRADNAQKLWIYQHRGPSNRTHHHHASVAGMVGQEAEGRMEERENWIPNYAFTELEFFPQDFENMKFVVGRARTSFFTYTVVVMKYLVERDEEGEAVCTGTVQMLGGQVKRTVGGKSEVLKDCRTEGERVKVLEDVFGIRLSERERKGIVGTVAELRGVAS